ncbi:hypothetical protein ABIB25_000750 [Nakamurella sp. UYEF19]|uniref:hypothetical protein n=1 Tax=Nakamurella sp. UYEF19 TaxID=1756392 RepID=UPI00339B3586
MAPSWSEELNEPPGPDAERTSLTSDDVFSDDGGVHQLATTTGNVTDGYVAALAVGV